MVIVLMALFTLYCSLFTTTAVAQKKTTTKTVSKKQPAKKQAVKSTGKQLATKKKQTKNTQPKQPAVTVKGLQNQRQQLQKQMKEQERRLRQNEKDVKVRLQNLMIINTEISDKRKTIDTIRRDIVTLDGNINTLNIQLGNLMFVFSAKNFSQMFRRMRFMREYAVYQRAQGEAVKSMQAQVEEAMAELSTSKKQKNDLLVRDEQEKRALEGKQAEQQNVVNSLQKQQKTIQSILEQQRKKDAALNAQIDKMIAEEIARAKARAEAERKRAAAEEARKKREAELARKKAEAEAAARENARRIAEAKAREEKAKAEARAAARKSEMERAAAEKAARDAENARRAAERKAEAEKKAHENEMAAAKKKSEEEWSVSSEDRRLSGNFESNKGRFPMPIIGPYKIVNTQGQNRVEGLKGTTIRELRGIELKGQPGAQVRSIFDGEVSGVARYGDAVIVIVRHGMFFSVYSDLSSASVRRGQKVSARQTLGVVNREGTMRFEIRRISGAPVNPLAWLAR